MKKVQPVKVPEAKIIWKPRGITSCESTYTIEDKYRVCITGGNYYVWDIVSETPEIARKVVSDVQNALLLLLTSQRMTPKEIYARIPEKYRYILDRRMKGYGLLDPFFLDPHVIDTFVMLRIPVQVIHLKYGKLKTNITLTKEELVEVTRRMASSAGKDVNEAYPLLSFIEPVYSTRVSIIYLSDVTMRKNMTVDIRKQPKKPWTILRLVKLGTLSIDEAAFLWLSMKNKVPILVMGPLASGKSVAPWTEVLVSINGSVKRMTIEDAWILFDKLVGSARYKEGYEYIPLDHLPVKILAFNYERPVWVRPSKIIRHPLGNSRLVRVKTASGANLTVTDDHSLLVYPVPGSAVCVTTPPSEDLVGLSMPAVRGSGRYRDRITGIEYTGETTGFVYDFEVPRYQNFYADGVFVHNTVLINAVSNTVPPDSRVITIEDAPELRLYVDYWTRTTTRVSEKNPITMFDIIKVALRVTNDYIIIGEVRGEEARHWAQGILVGHGGITSIHAEDPKAAIARLINPPLNVDPFVVKNINVMVRMLPFTRRGVGLVRRNQLYVYEGEEPVLVFDYDKETDSIVMIRDPLSFSFFKSRKLSKEELEREYEAMRIVLGDIYEYARQRDPELEFPDYKTLPRIMYTMLDKAMAGEYDRAELIRLIDDYWRISQAEGKTYG